MVSPIKRSRLRVQLVSHAQASSVSARILWPAQVSANKAVPLTREFLKAAKRKDEECGRYIVGGTGGAKNKKTNLRRVTGGCFTHQSLSSSAHMRSKQVRPRVRDSPRAIWTPCASSRDALLHASCRTKTFSWGRPRARAQRDELCRRRDSPFDKLRVRALDRSSC